MKEKITNAINRIKEHCGYLDGESFLVGYNTGCILTTAIIVVSFKVTTWACKRK